MDDATSHVLHSILLTAILYALMVYVLKQSHEIALNRSILIGTIALIYMILYGHSFPPGRMNPNIF
jgi:putative effector of murein hydrolase